MLTLVWSISVDIAEHWYSGLAWPAGWSYIAANRHFAGRKLEGQWIECPADWTCFGNSDTISSTPHCPETLRLRIAEWSECPFCWVDIQIARFEETTLATKNGVKEG
jgi:hypothetical protein